MKPSLDDIVSATRMHPEKQLPLHMVIGALEPLKDNYRSHVRSCVDDLDKLGRLTYISFTDLVALRHAYRPITNAQLAGNRSRANLTSSAHLARKVLKATAKEHPSYVVDLRFYMGLPEDPNHRTYLVSRQDSVQVIDYISTSVDQIIELSGNGPRKVDKPPIVTLADYRRQVQEYMRSRRHSTVLGASIGLTT